MTLLWTSAMLQLGYHFANVVMRVIFDKLSSLRRRLPPCECFGGYWRVWERKRLVYWRQRCQVERSLLWKNIEFLATTSVSPRMEKNLNSKPKTLEENTREKEWESKRKTFGEEDFPPLYINSHFTQLGDPYHPTIISIHSLTLEKYLTFDNQL